MRAGMLREARGGARLCLKTHFVTRACEEPKGKAAGPESPESVPGRYAEGLEGPATQPLGSAAGRSKKGDSDRAWDREVRKWEEPGD